MNTAEKLALQVIEAFEANDIDRIGTLVTEDFVDHGAPPWAPQGRAGYLTSGGRSRSSLFHWWSGPCGPPVR